MKMPMIGPFTTPPITMAASSIPGRYLCVLVDHFSHTKGKPDHKCDAECDSTKEECKYLGEEGLDNRGLLSLDERGQTQLLPHSKDSKKPGMCGAAFFSTGRGKGKNPRSRAEWVGAKVKIHGAGRGEKARKSTYSQNFTKLRK